APPPDESTRKLADLQPPRAGGSGPPTRARTTRGPWPTAGTADVAGVLAAPGSAVGRRSRALPRASCACLEQSATAVPATIWPPLRHARGAVECVSSTRGREAPPAPGQEAAGAERSHCSAPPTIARRSSLGYPANHSVIRAASPPQASGRTA